MFFSKNGEVLLTFQEILQKTGNLGICNMVKCNSVSLNIENYKI